MAKDRTSWEDSGRGKEALLTALIEGSPYAKVLVDERGRIVLVNAEAENLFGWPREDLLGRLIEVLVPERFGAAHPGLRTAFHDAPSARPMGAGRDLYGRRRDGSEVPIEIGLNPIETDAGSFILAAITDITERKRAEELRLLNAGMREHADEVEELNRELARASQFKSQFVATMSHELRTPLNAIVGAAELLGMASLEPRIQRYVETIAESAEALLSLINSILDFSKIEAGKLELKRDSLQLDFVLEGAADVSAQLARRKGVTIHTYVDPSIPPVVGDADRLRQVLLNLLGNAAKFTERGQIVARALPVDVAETGVVVRFEVQDSGIGIAPDVQARLFEPFVQARPGVAQQFGGTGLGLSISKRLIELMGGRIGVESAPGAGSLFWCTIPFDRAGREAAVAERGQSGLAGLIVSGDDLFVEIVERYMASWGVACRRASRRTEMLDALQAPEPPKWIAVVDLDDLRSGELSDLVDLARELLPERIVTIGEDGMLRKPVRQSYLFDAVVKAAAGDRAQRVPPACASQPAGPRSSAWSTAPVLVAEDNEQLQELVQMQFAELGIPAVFVSDGLQAVAAVGKQTYALVLMDWQMPNMDGMEAAKAIRAREAATGSTRIPIVAMTANAFAEDREACLAAGMDDHLPKPVRLPALRETIERWTSGRVKTT